MPKNDSSPTPTDLAKNDLARSGLSDHDRRRLGIRAMTPAETREETQRWRVPAYRIPYLDPDGRKTGFYRLRFLGDVYRRGTSDLLRYWQPPDTEPRIYLPGNVKAAPWSTLLADPERTLYITEGEKKAARVTKAGRPCLGLGGVWSWRSSRFRQPFLPDLDRIEWDGRLAVLVFDSDLATNEHVRAALHHLARRLVERGAQVTIGYVPPADDGGRQGVDDYLEAGGRIKDLETEDFVEQRHLHELQEELAVIEEARRVYHIPTGQLCTATELTTVLYADRRVETYTTSGKTRMENAADLWLRWPRRRTFRAITYQPGAGPVVNDRLNTWPGWGVEPAPGDASLFYELIDLLTNDADDGIKDWLIKWLAYPLQYPGTKLATAVVITSRRQGIGKSLLGYSLGRIYGNNFRVIDQSQLTGSFNSWARRRQFVLGEEVVGSDKRGEADHLKNLITREELTVNEKFQPEYVLPDRINYLLTSNHPDALFLDPFDRRFCVIEVGSEPKAQRWYREYDRWYRGNGAGALFNELLEIDLTDFDPYGAAPWTEGKRRMVDLSASDLDLLCRELHEDPSGTLQRHHLDPERHLWTLDELVLMVDPDGSRKTTKIALAKALRRCGLTSLPPTRTRDGTLRLWAIQDPRHWLQATPAERAQRYEHEREATRGPRGAVGSG